MAKSEGVVGSEGGLLYPTYAAQLSFVFVIINEDTSQLAPAENI
jgi:hypothetical protein